MQKTASFLIGLIVTAILLAASTSFAQACNHPEATATVAQKAAPLQSAKLTSDYSYQMIQAPAAKTLPGNAHSCCPCGCSQALCGGGAALISSPFDIPAPFAVSARQRHRNADAPWREVLFGMERPPRA